MRGPSVAPGEAGEDGWLRTSDLGRLDEEGYLYVLGRADDTIVTGGKNVSPAEVEQVLLEHPAVRGRRGARPRGPRVAGGGRGTVVLTRRTPVSEDELREFCRERLAPHKVPKAISFAPELPRNPQGKLQRDRLR